MKALALALALAALGCGPPKPKLIDFSETPRAFRSQDYRSVYEAWTRHRKVMFGMEPAIEVWATHKSWEFREAFIAHYGEIYRIPEAERAALRAAQLEATRSVYEFHLAVQTGKFEWNDLHRKSSAWRISLVDGKGNVLQPERIDTPKLPDAFFAEFFPSATAFSRVYLVSFSRKPGDPQFLGEATGRLTLAIASPIGRAELMWRAK